MLRLCTVWTSLVSAEGVYLTTGKFNLFAHLSLLSVTESFSVCRLEVWTCSMCASGMQSQPKEGEGEREGENMVEWYRCSLV